MRRHSGARALAREPGIHNPWSNRISLARGYGFRARRARARRPGMTGPRSCGRPRAYDWFHQIGLLGEHAHDVGFFHDQEILAVELNLGTRPFSEQYLVADLEIDRDQLAGLVAAAGTGCDDLALLRLFARGVWNDDGAGGLLLGLDTFHDHPIVQGAELGFRHDDLVAAQTAGFGLIRTGATLLALIPI